MSKKESNPSPSFEKPNPPPAPPPKIMEVVQQLIDEKQKMREALDFAISVIDSYQMDIRSSDNHKWLGVDLIKKGFCQGRVYKWAIKTAYKMAGIDKKKEHKEMEQTMDETFNTMGFHI